MGNLAQTQQTLKGFDMPVLTLNFKDKKIRDYPIAIGQTYTIGRKSTNEIVIDNMAVSGAHARLEPVATTFVLRDLDSTNGTFVNQERITLHNLRHMDVIMIGKHELVFDRSDLIKKTAQGPDLFQDDKTRILDTSEYRHLMQDSESKPADSHKAFQDKKEDTEQLSFFARLVRKIFG